jgi:selenide,water dikinase
VKDLEKRRRVMQRSMQLGHCICNAKKSCPCDVLQQYDVCPCAGERRNGQSGPVRLTSLVASAGCASKIDKATLDRVLRGLPFLDDPRVLVGAPAGDDAGVYRLTDELALVQTVDVFSPAVDDPYTFGQIAAANSLSDVYAMGGHPITALSIVGFPLQTAADEVLQQILRGGIDKMTEAGVPIVGGHSINDPEIKAGFAVTGLVHPDKIVTNAAARPGDCLILSKPLGTGIVSFALQIGRAPAGAAEAAARSMAALNERASKLMLASAAHACTDVTGFGLAGHLAAMAAASQVDVEIVWDNLPLLPGVLECLAEGIASGAVERNRESSGHCLVPGADVQPCMLDVCFDPQTSGGLLIALPEAAAGDLLKKLHDAGMPEAAIIGKVLASGPGRVFLRTVGQREIPPRASARTGWGLSQFSSDENGTVPLAKVETNPMDCCEHGDPAGQQAAGAQSDIAGNVAGIARKYREFLEAANAPGALDARTKRAMAIALSVLARCEPCVKSHVKKAREMGFSQAEIDEAAWLGISFGGSPAMAFYNQMRKG